METLSDCYADEIRWLRERVTRELRGDQRRGDASISLINTGVERVAERHPRKGQRRVTHKYAVIENYRSGSEAETGEWSTRCQGVGDEVSGERSCEGFRGTTEPEAAASGSQGVDARRAHGFSEPANPKIVAA